MVVGICGERDPLRDVCVCTFFVVFFVLAKDEFFFADIPHVDQRLDPVPISEDDARSDESAAVSSGRCRKGVFVGLLRDGRR